jgi:hypothetical protein
MAAVVYKIVNGSLTINSATVPVGKFHLSLVQNGIPTLRLEIDPVHFGDGSPEAGAPSDATAAAFGPLYARYVAIFEAIEALAGATASFSFKMVGTDGDIQALELAGWVVTDVGIGSFTYSSRLSVLVTISHPAVRLNDGGMYLLGESSDSSTKAPTGGLNVLAAAVAELKARAAASVVSGQPAANTRVMGMTNKLIETLPQVIEWSSGTSLPWPALDPVLSSFLPYAMQDAVASVRHVTPWEFVSRELVNNWFLCLRPTYWKAKLELGPHDPWAEPAITLPDTDIAATSVPSSGDRLSGIINASLVPALLGTTAARFHEGVKNAFSVAQSHIENIAGPVMPTNIPGYLSAVVEAYFKNKSTSVEGQQKSYTVNTASPTLQAFATEIAGSLGTAMTNVCKQTFCNYYRQGVSTTLKTRLLLNLPTGIDGAHIVPGFTCMVTSADAPFMKFLVTAVDHVVDCNANTAYTVVAGAHVSPAGQPNLTAMPNGVAPGNYIYR